MRGTVGPILTTSAAISGDPAGISNRLLALLLQGDDAGCWALVEAALERGVPLADLYVEGLAGALAGVGAGWARGEVDVAAEHRASATAGRVLHRMALLPLPPAVRGTVLVATPPGERHDLPAAILTEVLRLAGFGVVNLGADVPLDALAAAIARTDGLAGVCITATVVSPTEAVAVATAAVGAVGPGVPVLTGGPGFDARTAPTLLGADEDWASRRHRPTLPMRASDAMVRRLQYVTDATLASLDLDELLDDVTLRTIEALAADTMAVFLREGDVLVSRATRCADGALREDLRVPFGAGIAGRIAEHRGPSILDDLADAEPLSPLFTDKGVRAVVGVPLVVGGEVIGVVHVGSTQPAHFDDDDGRFLQLVADRVAQAIERTRLFDAEREARTLAEETQRRLAFLTHAGEVLGRSLDWQTTLDTTVSQAVPFLADWCAIDVIDDVGEVRCVAAAHRDESMVSLVRRLHDSRPPRREAAQGVGHVVRTGEARFWPVVTESGLAAVAGSPERLELFRALGPVSAMVLPVELRGRLVATVSFVQSMSGRRYNEADLHLAEELVRRTAVALDNARLFAERSEVARTLQDSLLPPHLPEIPGASVAGLFRAGGEGVDVGGDFYDVFVTEPGDWALVVGDVCGKGAAAAAVTAMGRYTVRAAAMQARRPSRVLHILNEAMLRQEAGRPFLTVAYARLQLGWTAGDSARVTVGCGGHPLPLILRADGSVESVGVPGTLLGCFAEVAIEDVSSELHPGDALVMYTDGVEEPRDSDGREFGVAGLRSVLSSCRGQEPAAINEAVYQAVAAHRGESVPDDIAIVTLRLA